MCGSGPAAETASGICRAIIFFTSTDGLLVSNTALPTERSLLRPARAPGRWGGVPGDALSNPIEKLGQCGASSTHLITC